MAEPTSSALIALGAGVAAATVALLGVEPQALIWGTVGASLGLAWAPATSRLRAVLIFTAVVLVCALLGTWVAEKFASGAPIARNSAACLLGLAFHPLVTAAVAKIPEVFDGVLAKVGLKRPS